MKLHWFTRKGTMYMPASIIGWIIFAATFGFTIFVFIGIDSRSHSVNDTLINFVFKARLIGVAYTLIAYFTERKPALQDEQ